MAVTALNQKTAFAERLQRIQSGIQFEHDDLIGQQTQKRYSKTYGKVAKKPKRSFGDKVMMLVAFLAGMSAVTLGRFAYFRLAQMDGLPPAFYDLGSRGMTIFALVIAAVLTVALHLSPRQRFQYLLLGCMVMYYGEAAVAASVPQVWSGIFTSDYAAEMAAQGQDFVAQPAG